MSTHNAETAYLFRHALVREAAYELQLPAERARLLAAAAEVLRRAPPEQLDMLAAEIADHLRAAGADAAVELEFALRAARYAVANYHHDDVFRLMQRVTEIGSPKNVFEARQALYTWQRRHRNDAAAARYQAMELFRFGRRENEPGAVAVALNSLAGLADARRACRLHRRAFRVASRAASGVAAGLALGNLAVRKIQLGEHRVALRLLLRAIEIHRKAQNPAGVGYYLVTLAGEQALSGDLPKARRTAEEGVRILRDLSAKQYLPVACGKLAGLVAKGGELDQAAELLAEAEQMATEISSLGDLADIRVHRALIALSSGRVEDAQRHWAGGARLMLELGKREALKRSHGEIVRACREAGVAVFKAPE